MRSVCPAGSAVAGACPSPCPCTPPAAMAHAERAVWSPKGIPLYQGSTHIFRRRATFGDSAMAGTWVMANTPRATMPMARATHPLARVTM